MYERAGSCLSLGKDFQAGWEWVLGGKVCVEPKVKGLNHLPHLVPTSWVSLSLSHSGTKRCMASLDTKASEMRLEGPQSLSGKSLG